MEDIKDKLGEYYTKLDELQKQCVQAEKDVIVAETNHENLIKQRQQLIEECEKFTGTSFENVPQLLADTQNELDNIMSKLSNINTTGVITPDDVEKINNLIAEFNIPVEE